MRAVDLFAGCGGLSLGLKEAGIDVAAAFDAWSAAIKAYRRNLRDHPALLWDLSDVIGTVAAIRSLCGGVPDLVAGGPPCQDFSSAGSREEGVRANLTRSYAEIVATLRPRYVIMENVEGARRSDAYATARSILVDAGYGLNERVLDASLCGVPQKRLRFFCVGALGGLDGFLDAHIDAALECDPMTVRRFLEQEGDGLTFEHYYRHPRSYSRRGIFSVDEPAPTMRGTNRPMPPNYRRHEGDTTDPSAGEVRALSAAMRARIQTFPTAYRWIGPRTHVEQMIGNAVPVRLGTFVGRCLMDYDRAVAAAAVEVMEFRAAA